MNNRDSNDQQDRMEKFLDNLMTDEERQQFIAEVAGDESFAKEFALQAKINKSLGDTFQFKATEPNVSKSKSNDTDSVPLQETSNKSTSSTHPIRSARAISLPSNRAAARTAGMGRRVFGLMLAASLLGLLGYAGWQFLVPDNTPAFQPRMLVAIYNDSVEEGFYPYYECHDMERFAETFKHRQGVALTLAEMPADRKMVGLSYLGGSSRESTAMLCEVKDQPVLVFVDLAENYDKNVMKIPDGSPLSVFSAEKFGLVFYEVNPFEEATMIDYMILDN